MLTQLDSFNTILPEQRISKAWRDPLFGNVVIQTKGATGHVTLPLSLTEAQRLQAELTALLAEVPDAQSP